MKARTVLLFIINKVIDRPVLLNLITNSLDTIYEYNIIEDDEEGKEKKIKEYNNKKNGTNNNKN